VVVGTTIDHEMQNEFRVTIVATGIGQGAPAAKSTTGRERGESRIPHINLVRDPDSYPPRETARPASARRVVGSDVSERSDSALDDYLDIPAFLRRQAE
jgi:cell division protein FtsZ